MGEKHESFGVATEAVAEAERAVAELAEADDTDSSPADDAGAPPQDKKPPGKGPTPQTTQDAAAEMIKKFFQSGMKN